MFSRVLPLLIWCVMATASASSLTPSDPIPMGRLYPFGQNSGGSSLLPPPKHRLASEPYATAPETMPVPSRRNYIQPPDTTPSTPPAGGSSLLPPPKYRNTTIEPRLETSPRSSTDSSSEPTPRIMPERNYGALLTMPPPKYGKQAGSTVNSITSTKSTSGAVPNFSMEAVSSSVIRPSTSSDIAPVSNNSLSPADLISRDRVALARPYPQYSADTGAVSGAPSPKKVPVKFTATNLTIWCISNEKQFNNNFADKNYWVQNAIVYDNPTQKNAVGNLPYSTPTTSDQQFWIGVGFKGGRIFYATGIPCASSYAEPLAFMKHTFQTTAGELTVQGHFQVDAFQQRILEVFSRMKSKAVSTSKDVYNLVYSRG